MSVVDLLGDPIRGLHTDCTVLDAGQAQPALSRLLVVEILDFHKAVEDGYGSVFLQFSRFSLIFWLVEVPVNSNERAITVFWVLQVFCVVGFVQLNHDGYHSDSMWFFSFVLLYL